MKTLLFAVVKKARALLASAKALVLTPFLIHHLRTYRKSELVSVDDVLNFCFNSYSGIIRPMQVEEELKELLDEVKDRQPQTMLEIGTARGGTLFCFANVMPETAKLISIDLPSGRFGGGYPRWKKPLYRSFVGPDQTLHLLRCDSHSSEAIRSVEELLDGRRLDLLFIDGDHTYEGVSKDFHMYSDLVSDGGVIALHDIVPHAPQAGCEVDRLWEELEARYRTQRIVKDLEQGWAGIGVVYL